MTQIFINKNNYPSEKQYILETIFSIFWGLDIELAHHDLNWTYIHLNQSVIKMPDVLFAVNKEKWLDKKSLPGDSCPLWDCSNEPFANKLVNPLLPILYGEKPPQNYVIASQNEIIFHFDLLGACFYMLSGYEEYVSNKRDNHDRFPHTMSHAYSNNYLERPLVNEYLEILWHYIRTSAPQLERSTRHFQLQVSHDVDIPLRYAFSGYKNVLKEAGKNALNFNMINALLQPVNYYRVKKGNVQKDPYYTFPFLMDLAEQRHLELTFYFIAENTHPMNADYDLSHPFMASLLSDIHKRGHKIGLHGGYLTYKDATQLETELNKLKDCCAKLGIDQSEWGNRQHYLRWNNPTTVTGLAKSGIDHDSTCGFPGHVGFKAGVCYEFPLYDLKNQKKTAVIERPLIAMEATLLGYMKLNYEQTHEKIITLADCCKLYNGQFSLLWHNSNLNYPTLKKLYQQILLSI
jgi:hypothetical protein